ncbi:hypothetical protein Btru_062733 [Bulinus truncatus]|nr:hypothetical protein Btru_062733 [Bulinus truncatus]
MFSLLILTFSSVCFQAIHVLGSPSQDISKRSFIQRCNMITELTGRRCVDYYDYGCFCGPGGVGNTPVDDTDRCCQEHDQCFGHLSCTFYWFGYFTWYSYNCHNGSCVCTDSSWLYPCARSICECDVVFSECLTNALYSDGHSGHNTNLSMCGNPITDIKQAFSAMNMLQIFVIVAMTTTVNAICSNTSWERSFDYAGLATCNERDFFIRGFERSEIPSSFWQSDGLHLIERVTCCSPPPQWSGSDLHTVHANWGDVLRKQNVWAKCPHGHFLQGLYRSDSGWPLYRGYLYHLKDGRCSRPVEHPESYAGCYTEDISDCFDGAGLCSCTRDGYHVTGIYIGQCTDLHCLDKLYCCRMAEKKVEINSTDDVKFSIMDKTLRPMASLAYMLGFGWPGGCRAPFVGEDFHKVNDTWVALKNGRCRGMKINHRLNIVYRDWSFDSKDVIFGDEAIEEFEPQVVYHGLLFYNGSEPANKTIRWRVHLKETMAHIIADKWSAEDRIKVEIKFNHFNASGFTCVNKIEYRNSNMHCSRSKFIEVSSSKVLQPRSYYTWRLKINKVRVTKPYTAINLVKFSTKFKSFLRKGERVNSSTTNYHRDFRSNRRRQIFSYQFGNISLPFYTALRGESNSNSSPWLWRDMKESFSYAQRIINHLTDESLYTFFLRGTLQKVTASEAYVLLEDTNHFDFIVPNGSQDEAGDDVFDNAHPLKTISGEPLFVFDIHHVMTNPKDTTPNVTNICIHDKVYLLGFN